MPHSPTYAMRKSVPTELGMSAVVAPIKDAMYSSSSALAAVPTCQQLVLAPSMRAKRSGVPSRKERIKLPQL